MSSPKRRGQLQSPPSLQHNENQSYFCSRNVARADSLTTHICLQPSLGSSGAIPPLNLSNSIGTTSLYLDILPMYI